MIVIRSGTDRTFCNVHEVSFGEINPYYAHVCESEEGAETLRLPVPRALAIGNAEAAEFVEWWLANATEEVAAFCGYNPQTEMFEWR